MTRLFRRAVSGVPRRAAGLWPFSPDSAWNTPIGAGATFQASTAPATADLLNATYEQSFAVTSWSHPIYYATASDPLVTVTMDGGDVFTYRIPVGATPALPDISTGASSDSHMHVVQPDGKTMFEVWLFEWTSSTTATAGYLVETDLTSNGLLLGVRGYGGSAIGGLIRAHEVVNGNIPHAIAVALTNGQMKVPFVWPATRQDSNGASIYTGNNPMGTLAAIPSTVNLASLGLTANGLVLAKALQDYGMYVTDSADNFALYFEPSTPIPPLDDMFTDFPAIRAQLRVVTNNTQANGGTPGTRRRPPAPRLIISGSSSGSGGGSGGTATPGVREVLTNATYSGTNSSTTVTTGAATQAGDLLVAIGGQPYNPTGITPTTLPAAPTGTAGTWTNRGSVNRQDSRPHLQIWTRPVTVAGAQTVTWGVSPTGVDCSAHLAVFVLSGSGLSVVDAAISIAVPATTSWPAPSVTCAAGDLLLCGWQPFNGGAPGGTSTAPTIPGSMSNAATTPLTDGAIQRSAREVITTGTTTGTRTATGPTTNVAYAAGSITIRVAA